MSRRRRLSTVATIAVFLALLPGRALADGASTCLDAVARGQELRDLHKLLEARGQFRICAAPSCPPVLQHDCTGWVDEADKAIPTVVVEARDSSGNDVFDVHVSIDGVARVNRIDGAAIPLDPGPHTFRFEWPDGTSLDKQMLVPEGQKALVVSATAAAPAAPPPVPPLTAVTAPASQPPPPPPPHFFPVRTAGYVVGGVGVAVLAAGSVIGAMAISRIGSAKGECTPGCSYNTNPAAGPDMHTGGVLADASTGTVVAGGALVAGGVLMVLLGGAGQGHRTVEPVAGVGAQGTTLGLRGIW
jgi:hypothetical protein